MYRLRLKPTNKMSLVVIGSVQNSTDKMTKKSADEVEEEPKMESSESLELSNEEYKSTGSVKSEDLDARNIK